MILHKIIENWVFISVGVTISKEKGTMELFPLYNKYFRLIINHVADFLIKACSAVKLDFQLIYMYIACLLSQKVYARHTSQYHKAGHSYTCFTCSLILLHQIKELNKTCLNFRSHMN